MAGLNIARLATIASPLKKTCLIVHSFEYKVAFAKIGRQTVAGRLQTHPLSYCSWQIGICRRIKSFVVIVQSISTEQSFPTGKGKNHEPPRSNLYRPKRTDCTKNQSLRSCLPMKPVAYNNQELTNRQGFTIRYRMRRLPACRTLSC